MIEIFRKNIFINSLLLIPYICILRIKSLVQPNPYPILETDSPLSKMIFSIFPEAGLIQAILTVLLLFFHAAFINRMVNINRLENESTLFPGVFYIIFCSAFPQFLYFSPLLIGMTFVLIAFAQIFTTYKRPKSDHVIFSSGFWVGVATLIYLPFIVFLIALLVGLINLRSFKISEVFQTLVGFVIPFFLFGTFLFWNDSLGQLSFYFSENIGYLEGLRKLTSIEIFAFTTLAILILSSVLAYGAFTSRKNIQITKKIDILYWCFIVGLFAFGMKQPDKFMDLQIMAFPLAIFLAFFFLRIKNKLYTEMIHLMVVTAIIVLQFRF